MSLEYWHFKSTHHSPKQWGSFIKGFSFPNFCKQRALNYKKAQEKFLQVIEKPAT